MNGGAEAHGRSEGATMAPSHPGNETIDALVVKALDYQAEAFDHDEPVDGGDLVEWFAAWRVAVRLARGVGPKA